MVSIRALRADDDRSGFSSGNDDLDRFFRRFAAANQFAEHIGTTYLALGDKDRILGFATVAATSIRADAFPATRSRKLPRYPLPALRLARLAVSKDEQKSGIGTLLLRYVLALALEQALKVGCVGVVVDAKPESLRFYSKFGFEPTDAVEGQSLAKPEPVPLFLGIATIKMALGKP